MNLIEIARKIWTLPKKPEPVKEEPKLESLCAVIVPKKMLTDKSYKQRDWTVRDDYRTYFDSCALDINRSLLGIYGEMFDMQKVQTEGNTTYTLTRGDTKVTYYLIGTDSFTGAISSDKDRSWSNEVTGTLLIEQPHIDLQKVSKVLNSILEHHLLDYRESRKGYRFGVFLSKDGNIEEGNTVMEKLELRPKEAAMLVQVMYFAGYSYIQFSEQPGNAKLITQPSV